MAMTRAFRSFRSFISSQAGSGRCRLAGSIRAMNSSYRPMAAMMSVAPIRNRSISVRNRRRFWASERMIGDVRHRVHRDHDPVDERADPGQHQDDDRQHQGELGQGEPPLEVAPEPPGRGGAAAWNSRRRLRPRPFAGFGSVIGPPPQGLSSFRLADWPSNRHRKGQREPCRRRRGLPGDLPRRTARQDHVRLPGHGHAGPPFAVWIGATAAFAVRVVIAITVGVLLNDILPHRAVEVAVALTFFAGAGFALCDGLRGGDDPGQADRLQPSRVPYALGA